MKATELRIGNIVEKHYIRSNNDRVVNEPMFAWDFTCMESEPALYKPIPLTEEWLVKFGFKLDIKIGYYWRGPLGCCNLWQEGNIYCFDYPNTRTSLEYVHQLQNLYFSLTGEELILK